MPKFNTGSRLLKVRALQTDKHYRKHYHAAFGAGTLPFTFSFGLDYAQR